MNKEIYVRGKESLERSHTPFETWAQAEGIPIVRGYFVEDAYTIPLKTWNRKGGPGALIILDGGEGFSSAYLCEIPPGVSLKPQRHLFEEVICILQGKGETAIWNDDSAAQKFAWQEHSLFSPPLNAWHKHKNTGSRPVKYLAVTSAPLTFNAYRNSEFVFNTNFSFKDRYDSESGYFDGQGKMVDMANWVGGFIPDLLTLDPPTTKEYGKGLGTIELSFSGNGMGSHIAEIEVGTYKKPHRHSRGAHIVVLEGDGYALMWENWDKKIKVDFHPGTIYSPPEGWWHTHCNTGTKVVKHIAVHCRGFHGVGKIYRPRLGVTKGGDMLEREDENPEIKSLFEAELAKNGLKSRMNELK